MVLIHLQLITNANSVDSQNPLTSWCSQMTGVDMCLGLLWLSTLNPKLQLTLPLTDDADFPPKCKSLQTRQSASKPTLNC